MGETVLKYADNNLEIMKELINRGANINAKCNCKNTILMSICAGFDSDETYDLINYLIEENADLNIQNDIGYSGMMYAAYRENVRVMKLLFDNGADPCLENDNGKTFLDLIKTDSIRNEMKNYIEVPAPKPAKKN
jgi:ankyrin repeat protein